jgi:glyoxylase-like metal-dependent hydrolase (beta-lactamase superfamily II)
MVVLKHGHPDHLWGVLDAADNPIYPRASYVVSAREWDLWADPGVLQTLPAAMPRERMETIVNGARMVQDGDEIVGGVR